MERQQRIKTKKDIYKYIREHTGGRFNQAEIRLFVTVYERMLYESLLNREKFMHPGLFSLDTRIMPPTWRGDPINGGKQLIPEMRKLKLTTSKPLRRILRRMDENDPIDVSAELKGFDDLPPDVLKELEEGLKNRRLIEKATEKSDVLKQKQKAYRQKRKQQKIQDQSE